MIFLHSGIVRMVEWTPIVMHLVIFPVLPNHVFLLHIGSYPAIL